MGTLRELTEEMYNLLTVLEDPEYDQDSVMCMIQEVSSDIDKKVDGYCTVIKQLEGQAEILEKEAKRCSEESCRILDHVSRMKSTAIGALHLIGKTKVPGELYKMSVVKNGGLQPLKITGDVPERFTKIKIEPDNEKIRQALKDGENLDFCYLEERGEHLIIK